MLSKHDLKINCDGLCIEENMETYWHLMQYNATLHTTDSIHVFANAFVDWLSQGLWPPHTNQTLVPPLHSADQNSVHVSTLTIGTATNYSTGKLLFLGNTLPCLQKLFFPRQKTCKEMGQHATFKLQ